MLVLGIHMEHDAAAALVKDGEILVAISQERLTKIKKDPAFHPDHLINYVLDATGYSIYDIDHVAISTFMPNKGVRMFAKNSNVNCLHNPKTLEILDRGHFLNFPWINDEYTEEREEKYYAVVDVEIWGVRIPGSMVSHHIAHGAASFYTSKFEEAAIFSLDASAVSTFTPEASSLFMYGKGNRIFKLYSPGCMMGFTYNVFPIFIGMGPGVYKAGSFMGLSSYGKVLPQAYKFEKEFTAPYWETTLAKRSYEEHVKWQWMMLSGKPPIDLFDAAQVDSQDAMDIAASIQYLYEKAVHGMLDRLYEETEHINSGNLCLSGGSFLNCASNGKYVQQTEKWNDVHIMPASGDDGTALGAALYMTHSVFGIPRILHDRTTYMYMGQDYIVPDFVEWRKSEKLDYVKLARYIKDGKVVAWYNGRSEFGPRALGNRSFLASPLLSHMRDHINFNVKGREWFRPFAPMVVAEKASEWFELDHESPFMLEAVKVLEEKADQIPAVVHVDGTSRVQTVSQKDNAKIYKLLKAFEKETGVPILLNTSLNLAGEPLVETPQDAFSLFTRGNVDILVIGEKMYLK
jgi:carbamoyltransferase